MEENITAQLKDIKPLLEIPDNTFYIYWGLIILASILVVVVVFFVVKKFWKESKENVEKGYLSTLKNLDWSQTKKAAYTATFYARKLAKDERRKELFSQLEPMLEQYKYKKVVETLDDATQKQFNLYIQVCDESI